LQNITNNTKIQSELETTGGETANQQQHSEHPSYTEHQYQTFAVQATTVTTWHSWGHTPERTVAGCNHKKWTDVIRK